MLIKLDDAERVVHATIFDLCMKDKNTCAGDYSAYALEALRALPVSDGWEDIATAPQDKYIILCGYLDGPHDPRIKMGYFWSEEKRWAIDGASWRPIFWRPLPAPPTIE